MSKAPLKHNSYSKELADKICEKIRSGESVMKLSHGDDMPCFATIHEWVRDKPDFREDYYAAQSVRKEFLRDQCLEIAFDSSRDIGSNKLGDFANTAAIARDKLKIDTNHRIEGTIQHHIKRREEKDAFNFVARARQVLQLMDENEITPERAKAILECNSYAQSVIDLNELKAEVERLKGLNTYE